MSELLSLLNREGDALTQHGTDEVMQLNDLTRSYGLSLTYEQAAALLKTRVDALKSTRRIEVGAGAIDKLITAFCDSPYIDEQNYADTLCSLTELFYYFKSETIDLLPDDELIEAMKKSFDGDCCGSIELLAEQDLDTIARNLRAFGTVLTPDEIIRRETPDRDDMVEEDGEWRTMRF